MSTYRTSMMLYSSVFALSLIAASDGFSTEKSEASKVEKAPAKEKSSERETVKASDSKDKKATAVKEIVAPLTDAEEAAEEEQKRKKIEQAQRKSQFANKIETIRVKYAALLSSISGEPKEIIAKKLAVHTEKVRAALLEALSDPKSDAFDKLEKGLKRKNTFIQSKKESVGAEDAAWFNDVHVAAEKQLKRLAKLNAEFEKNKGNAPEQEKTKLIYADRINNFLASYDMLTACTHYLASAKAYCNDASVSFNNMKVQFPDFSSKAFKEATVPGDILNGKRDPFASIKGFKFYAIGKDEYTDGKFSSQIPADSEDGLYIAEVQNKPMYQILLAPENGGVILSSKMVQKAGMDRPICVFSSYAADGKKETIYRFSLVHETEELAGKQLTAQLIHAENQPAYDELAAANGKLKEALKEAAKKPKDKAEKKIGKDADKKKDKVQEKDTKAKATEDGDKPKAKATKADKAKKADKADEVTDKPKDKTASTEEAADKPAKKALNAEIEEAAGKPKAKKAEKTPDSSDKKTEAVAEEKPEEPKEPKKKDSSFFGNLFG